MKPYPILFLAVLLVVLAACEQAPTPAKPAVREARTSVPARPAPRLESEPTTKTEKTAPRADREPYRVGGEITRPVVIRRSHLTFDLAKKRRAGLHLFELIIDERGDVKSVRVIRGSDPEIDAAARVSLRQWKFEPATLRGKPVPVYYMLTMNIDVQ